MTEFKIYLNSVKDHRVENADTRFLKERVHQKEKLYQKEKLPDVLQENVKKHN